MPKRVSSRLALAILSSVFATVPVAAQFPRDQLQAMFDQAKEANSDLSKPHLWGFYFISPTRAPLDTAATLLVAEGYRLVAIQQVQPDAWQLHVERVEAHSADSLHALNSELEEFAKVQGIEKIHQMDVGLAPIP